ncbi:MAG: hypothetical protein IT385_30830 [Deltaproteobacteria bacterium]|nr:hypothetical protein [Deltaproteobacteria bacterium]
MCDKTSTLQGLVLLLAALLGFLPACDSNPTPHPGKPDAHGGRETSVTGEPNEGYVDGPGDDTDRDPAAGTPDAGETGAFEGGDGEVVDGDALVPDAGPDDVHVGQDGGEVAAPSGDNSAACSGEADDLDPDGDGRLED